MWRAAPLTFRMWLQRQPGWFGSYEETHKMGWIPQKPLRMKENQPLNFLLTVPVELVVRDMSNFHHFPDSIKQNWIEKALSSNVATLPWHLQVRLIRIQMHTWDRITAI